MICYALQFISIFLEAILSKLYFINNDGHKVLDDEWKYLIILDACRFDVFLEAYKKGKIRGKLEYRISRGGSTEKFLLENFSRKKFYRDIVYVTANPFVSKLLNKNFYKIIPVWKIDWNEEQATVLPSSVYKYAVESAVKYKDKKVIIHFMQPHFPYIYTNIKDRSVEQLREHVLKDNKRAIWIKIENCRQKIRPLLKIFQQGFFLEIDRNKHLELYKHNLYLVLNYVNKLIKILPGKIVVTSDHGEAFGEKVSNILPVRVYGHMGGIRIPSLVVVPWLTVENDYSYKRLEREYYKIKVKGVKIPHR